MTRILYVEDNDVMSVGGGYTTGQARIGEAGVVPAGTGAKEVAMNEDVFNASIRIRQALAEGRLKGNETFPARATVTLGGIGFSHEINGEIELG